MKYVAPIEEQNVPKPLVNYRRFRAVLDLRGMDVEELARQACVSSRHIWFVLRGQRRPSSVVLDAIRGALGPSGWAFAVGDCNTLADEGAPHAAA